MAGNFDLRPDDLVRVTLTLKARDRADELVLNEGLTVEQLGMGRVAARRAVEVPQFDTARYVELLRADPEAASRMMVDFHEVAADAVAEGAVPEGEQLAGAIVSHFVRNGARGNKIVNDANSPSGYVLTTDEINIVGPVVVGDTRVWKATAVGTWGKVG